MITVVIPCWKRFHNLERILRAWLYQLLVDEIILWNNSDTFKTYLPITIFSANKNLGPIAKYMFAQYARNDVIIFADDDILAKPGFAHDLLTQWDKKKMVGIMGRQFTGKSYYDSKSFHARGIKKPVRVDYLCGVIMMVSKANCFVDIKKRKPNDMLEDWWFQREIGLPLWVVPTKNYELLPESEDADALHRLPSVRKIREEHYKKWILTGIKDHLKIV